MPDTVNKSWFSSPIQPRLKIQRNLYRFLSLKSRYFYCFLRLKVHRCWMDTWESSLKGGGNYLGAYANVRKRLAPELAEARARVCDEAKETFTGLRTVLKSCLLIVSILWLLGLVSRRHRRRDELRIVVFLKYMMRRGQHTVLVGRRHGRHVLLR